MLLFRPTRGDSKTYLYVEPETTFQPLAYRLCPIMNTRWRFSPGKEIWKSFLLYSFAARPSSCVYFYLNGMCSSFEHLIPAVNLQQSCELRPPRRGGLLWEAQGQLIIRPKTSILPHPIPHVVQNKIMFENKAVRLHSSFLDATRPVLRIWLQWMPF